MYSPRRFIIAAPTRVGRTKVGLNIGQALRRLGHQVTFFDYDRKPPSSRFLPRFIRPRDWGERYIDYVNEGLLRLVKKIGPEVFLCVKGVQFLPNTIQAIGEMGVITVGYWIDDPLDLQRSLVNAGAFHCYFTNDASCVPRYRDQGIRRIFHLPSAADTRLFHPLPGTKFEADVVFVGTHSPYRESIIQELQDFDLRVYGPGWKKAHFKKGHIFPEAFGSKTNKIFNAARINLNIHNWFGQGTAMNLRLFEVPAAGGFLLTDWVAEINDAYTDKQHLVCWRTVDELKEKIRFYLNHESERLAIARRGHAHFLAHHSYEARVLHFLECLQSAGPIV